MTNLEFIKTIAPSFQKWGKQYGYKIVSAAIAQACLESQYGNSYKATFGHNILGLKYRPNRIDCNDGYFLDGGSEQNPNGTYTPLPSSTAWYNFKNWDACVHGYYEFINIPNYAKVRFATTPLEYLQAIKDAGYATSINYVQNVYNVIQKWNLTQYDNFNGITKNNNFVSDNQINIIKSIGMENITKKANRKIDYIVLHYTAGTHSEKGSARNVANYFNKITTKASADYIVDDEEIVQYNPDPKNYYCWSVGGSKYNPVSTSLGGIYYSKCQNSNAINIEMCSRKVNINSLKASDDDWYITEKTANNAIILVKYLMKLFNVKIDHVIMHHEVTGKLCPQPWCKNELALPQWYNFLNRIKAGAGSNLAIQQPKPQTTSQPAFSYPKVPFLIQVLVPNLNIRETPDGKLTGKTTGLGKFTITDLKDNWGLLKSGLGWVYLNNTEFVKILG